MKVVLCTVPQKVYESREGGEFPRIPNFAIISLSHWMEKFGYSGEFYDIDMLLPSEDEIFDYFKSKQPDVVGISAVVSASYLQVKTISGIIRRACPSAWIVLGGNMAASANVVLRKTEVDICVLGDGEIPWVAFLDYVKSHGTNKNIEYLGKIKGLAFLNEQDEMEFTGYGEPIPDNENPFPDYDLLAKGLQSHPEMITNYFREGKKLWYFKNDPRTYEPNRKPNHALIFTTKGCVNRCTFCQRFCKGYRLFDLEKLDFCITELKEKYNVGFISLSDENFGSSKKYSYEIARIMKKHNMQWLCGGVRCTSFIFEDFKFFKECGCTGATFGVESGSQKILDIMEKRFKVDDVYAALKNANETGIYAPLLFCIGMPGETDQTIMESGEFLANIARTLGVSPMDVFSGATYAMPFPGTPLYEYGQLHGVIGGSVDEDEAFLIYVSDKTCSKDNFVNLTSMSTKTVLFWDFLLVYEATRTFYRNPIKKQNRRDRKRGNNLFRSWLRSLSFSERVARFLWKPITCLNEILTISPLVANIPRPLLYIPMRNLLYAEYRIHIFLRHIVRLFGNRGRRIAVSLDLQNFQIKLKKCRPLTETQSLRKINKRLRDALPPPQTLTEKNQQILRLGR